MSAREWKPGDVAMTTFGLSIVAADLPRCSHDGRGLHWHHLTGGWDYLSGHAATARRVVVLDPASTDDLDRLTKAIVEAAHKDGNIVVSGNGIHPDTVGRALREFANPTPPRPEEPTGLGAVVEDAEGVRWVRYAPEGDTAPWVAHAVSVEYDDIAAVHILSEGVTP